MTCAELLPTLACVYRRAYALLVGIAVLMGVLAVLTALLQDKRLVDPDGFLGPSWAAAAAARRWRLPARPAAADPVVLAVVPSAMWPIVRDRVRTHWTRERLTLVVLGIVCFYVTYVSYRNLKSFLPFVLIDTKYDRELHLLDRLLFFGHDPGVVFHTCSAPASRPTCCPTSTCGSCRWCRSP